MDRPVPRVVWLAVAIGVIARLVFGLGYWVDKPLTHDEREYLLLARNVASGRGFVYLLPDGSQAPGEHFGRAPFYPLFLAGVIRVSQAAGIDAAAGPLEGDVARPAVLRAIRTSQAALGGLLVWLVGWMAGRAAGSRAAATAAWLAALYPPLVWTPAYVFSETLYAVVALGCAAVLNMAAHRIVTPAEGDRGRVPDRGSVWLYAASGILAGLAVLTRPAMLFFLVLAGPWVWWTRGVRPAAVFAIAAVLAVAPWSVYNTRTAGRFVPIASEGGITFWTGNHAMAIGEGDLAANPDLKRANLELRARHPGLSPEQLESIYYREAWRFIRDHPVWWAWLLVRKLFYTIVPIGPSYRLHSPLYLWSSVASYLGVLPFALAGLARLVRTGRVPVPLLLLAAGSVLASVVFLPQERFRIPVVDPALLVMAASLRALRP